MSSASKALVLRLGRCDYSMTECLRLVGGGVVVVVLSSRYLGLGRKVQVNAAADRGNGTGSCRGRELSWAVEWREK